MAILKFETPEGKHCNGQMGDCLALDASKHGYCKFFKEFLTWDTCTYVRCDECRALGKYGTCSNVAKP